MTQTPPSHAHEPELDALRAENTLLRAALEQLPLGLSIFDAQDRLVLANTRYREMWCLPAALVQAGVKLQVLREAAAATETAQSLARPLPPDTAAPRQRDWQLPDGRLIQVAATRGPDGSGVALHLDITAAAASRIGHLDRHDALTGLPDRRALAEALLPALQQQAGGSGLAVLCIDLDRFKPVNDSLGHTAGDQLLVQVAERLRQCVRDHDPVVRLGGDEFAVLQAGVPQPRAAAALARRIVEALGQAFTLDAHPVHIGCSIGIAVAPFDGEDAEALLRHADLALCRAKDEGRGTWRFFEPEMQLRQTQRRQLEADLREALAAQQFELAYQPQLSLGSGRVTGVEALLRWQHPQRGSVSPAEFIPLAEEAGLIEPLGRWVLARACAEASRWPASVRVAVNVSPLQFQGSLLTDVLDALQASGLAPGRLEVEITESAMLRDPQRALATLEELRGHGVRVAMDDFGTGYSSLSTLRSFPFDRLKLDRSFVRDALTRPDTLAIVRAVAGLGRSLGMATTAEGVETPAQRHLVQEAGFDELQGFLFSRPVPAAALAPFFEPAAPPAAGTGGAA